MQDRDFPFIVIQSKQNPPPVLAVGSRLAKQAKGSRGEAHSKDSATWLCVLATNESKAFGVVSTPKWFVVKIGWEMRSENDKAGRCLGEMTGV